MTGPDLIRLAEELARCGGVHRLTTLVTAAVHVCLEHERRHRTVENWETGPHGVGMSDKVGRPWRDPPHWSQRGAPSRPPEREEPSGRCVEAQDGRGGSDEPETALGWKSHAATLNPSPVMPERGERVSLRTGNAPAEERGVTHASDSPVLTRAQSDFGRRLVPRHMPPVERINPEDDGA